MLEHIAMAAQEDLRKMRRRRRYVDPTPLNEQATVYVVYHWHAQQRRWDLVAFLHTNLQRFPSQKQMDRLRVRLLKKNRKWLQQQNLVTFNLLKFVELSLCAQQGPPITSPYNDLKIMRHKLADRALPKYLYPEIT